MIEIGADRFRSKAAASPEHNAGSGGYMDDFLKRLGVVEVRLGALEIGVAEIRAQVPHFATKADVLAAKADIIKWMIGTAISCGTMAFAAAKLIH
jgi:hypothetical protein